MLGFQLIHSFWAPKFVFLKPKAPQTKGEPKAYSKATGPMSVKLSKTWILDQNNSMNSYFEA